MCQFLFRKPYKTRNNMHRFSNRVVPFLQNQLFLSFLKKIDAITLGYIPTNVVFHLHARRLGKCIVFLKKDCSSKACRYFWRVWRVKRSKVNFTPLSVMTDEGSASSVGGFNERGEHLGWLEIHLNTVSTCTITGFPPIIAQLTERGIHFGHDYCNFLEK